MTDKKSSKEINKKTAALLALEAKMIERDQEVYNLENYIPEMFSQIEEVLAAERPERLLDKTELETFQTLIMEHTGGERRKGIDRRTNKTGLSEKNRRSNDRRWAGIPDSKK